MTVYVDEFKLWVPDPPRPFHEGSAHLSADSIDELHMFASRIGLKREWFQNHRILPHYDLTKRKYAKALGAGAQFMSARERLRTRKNEPPPAPAPAIERAAATVGAGEPSEKRNGGAVRLGFDLPQLTDAQLEANERAAAEREKREESERFEKLRRSLAEQGAPVKDIERILDDELEDSKSFRACKRAIEAQKLILILSGGEGGGKTTAAAWWLVQKRLPHRYLKTYPALFVRAARLPRWPRFRVSGQAGIDPPEWRELAYAEALVIDDLGVEYIDDKGAFMSMFDELIDIRYAGLLPTLITTNVPPEDLNKRYGARFSGRVAEVGALVGVPGESRRRRKPPDGGGGSKR